MSHFVGIYFKLEPDLISKFNYRIMAEREIRMRNIPKTHMQQSENIAAYHGYPSVAKWAKAEFLKIIASFPDHIKNSQWRDGEKIIAGPVVD